MSRKPTIKVLVVEDSELMSREISRSLQAHPRLTVVGTASNGDEGRRLVKELKPDVVTLDVNMPGMDGLTCLQYIMVERPTPCVIVSAMTGESAFETFEAYELGAVAVVQKPDISDRGSLPLFKRRLAAQVIRASYADVDNVSRARLSRPTAEDSPKGKGPKRIPRRLVVIGSSTGGPRTLMEIIPALPADLPAAVLVVQHMPGNFTASFAERLDEFSQLPVREAVDGEVLGDGRVYVAPGDFHLNLVSDGVGHKCRLELLPGEHELLLVPCIDTTMGAAIDVFGPAMVGVILTGLGSDGAASMVRLNELGGVTIAESEASAVIYGMPRAVVERGAAQHVLPARKIAEKIVESVMALAAEGPHV